MSNRSPVIVNRVRNTPGYRALFNEDKAMVREFGSFESFLAHVSAIEVQGEPFQPKGAETPMLRCSVRESGPVETYGGEEFRQKQANETWPAYRVAYAEWKAIKREEW